MCPCLSFCSPHSHILFIRFLLYFNVSFVFFFSNAAHVRIVFVFIVCTWPRRTCETYRSDSTTSTMWYATKRGSDVMDRLNDRLRSYPICLFLVSIQCACVPGTKHDICNKSSFAYIHVLMMMMIMMIICILYTAYFCLISFVFRLGFLPFM